MERKHSTLSILKKTIAGIGIITVGMFGRDQGLPATAAATLPQEAGLPTQVLPAKIEFSPAIPEIKEGITSLPLFKNLHSPKLFVRPDGRLQLWGQFENAEYGNGQIYWGQTMPGIGEGSYPPLMYGYEYAVSGWNYGQDRPNIALAVSFAGENTIHVYKGRYVDPAGNIYYLYINAGSSGANPRSLNANSPAYRPEDIWTTLVRETSSQPGSRSVVYLSHPLHTGETAEEASRQNIQRQLQTLINRLSTPYSEPEDKQIREIPAEKVLSVFTTPENQNQVDVLIARIKAGDNDASKELLETLKRSAPVKKSLEPRLQPQTLENRPNAIVSPDEFHAQIPLFQTYGAERVVSILAGDDILYHVFSRPYYEGKRRLEMTLTMPDGNGDPTNSGFLAFRLDGDELSESNQFAAAYKKDKVSFGVAWVNSSKQLYYAEYQFRDGFVYLVHEKTLVAENVYPQTQIQVIQPDSKNGNLTVINAYDYDNQLVYSYGINSSGNRLIHIRNDKGQNTQYPISGGAHVASLNDDRLFIATIQANPNNDNRTQAEVRPLSVPQYEASLPNVRGLR